MPNQDGKGLRGHDAMNGRNRRRNRNHYIPQIEETENQSEANKDIIYCLGNAGRFRNGSGSGNLYNKGNEQTMVFNRCYRNRIGINQKGKL